MPFSVAQVRVDVLVRVTPCVAAPTLPYLLAAAGRRRKKEEKKRSITLTSDHTIIHEGMHMYGLCLM